MMTKWCLSTGGRLILTGERPNGDPIMAAFDLTPAQMHDMADALRAEARRAALAEQVAA